MTPTRDEIQAQLDRVLASELFQSTSRLSRFLRFVTERAMTGEGERLKEFVIGVEVFDRDSQFDPRLDSIVRVEAGRLRTRLDQYYQGTGREDPLLIQLPKGSYAPFFQKRASSPADFAPVPAQTPSRRRAALALGAVALLGVLAISAFHLRKTATLDSAERPVNPDAVAVLAFQPDSAEPEAARLAGILTEAVTAAMVRGGVFPVVPGRDARAVTGSVAQISQRLGAAWLLEARVLGGGGSVAIEARLVNAERNQKVWVESFHGEATKVDALARDVAAGATAALRHHGTLPPR